MSKDNIYKYENNNICQLTKKRECPEEFPYINIINNICVKDCKLEEILSNTCLINNPKEKIKGEIILKIQDYLLNGTLDLLLLNITEVEKKDLLFFQNDILFQITTSDNQKIIHMIIYHQ